MSVVGLKDLAPAKPVQVIIHKANGPDVTIQANHSMTAQQLAWFKSGICVECAELKDIDRGKIMTTKTSKIIYTKTDEAPCWRRIPSPDRQSVHQGGRRVGRVAGYLFGGTNSCRLSRSSVGCNKNNRMIWPNWASLPRRRKPISSNYRTSAPRIPQIKGAIKELQSQAYKVPDYPENPKDRHREGHQGAVRQSQRERRQPGAYVKATRIAGRPSRSSNIPDKHPIKWGPGL